MRRIPTVEMDCTFQGVHHHVLGYGIRGRDSPFLELEEELLQQERQGEEQRMEHIETLGSHFSRERARLLARGWVIT